MGFHIELGQVHADTVHLAEAARAGHANARGGIEAREIAEQTVRHKKWGVSADEEVHAVTDVWPTFVLQ